MPWIDANNVDQFIGKTVDSKTQRFHYYPLTILYRKDIGYCHRAPKIRRPEDKRCELYEAGDFATRHDGPPEGES